MTETLRDKLIRCGWASNFSVDTLVGLIEKHYAALAQPEPVGPTRRQLMMLADDMGMACVGAVIPAEYARAVLARWGRPAPQPVADGEVAELASELRHFLAGYQQMRGRDPEHIYSIHRGDAKEAHLTVSCLTRIADLLERQQPVPGEVEHG